MQTELQMQANKTPTIVATSETHHLPTNVLFISPHNQIHGNSLITPFRCHKTRMACHQNSGNQTFSREMTK